MSLINCPECGKQVSDKARSCPNCGYPIIGNTPSPTVNGNPTNDSEKPDYFTQVMQKQRKQKADRALKTVIAIAIFTLILAGGIFVFIKTTRQTYEHTHQDEKTQVSSAQSNYITQETKGTNNNTYSNTDKSYKIVNNDAGTTIKMPTDYISDIGCPVDRVIQLMKTVAYSPNVVVTVVDHSIKQNEDHPEIVTETIYFNYDYTSPYGYRINMDMGLLTSNQSNWSKIYVSKLSAPESDFSMLDGVSFNWTSDIMYVANALRLTDEVLENARNQGINKLTLNITLKNIKSLCYVDSSYMSPENIDFNTTDLMAIITGELLGKEYRNEIPIDKAYFLSLYPSLEIVEDGIISMTLVDDLEKERESDYNILVPQNIALAATNSHESSNESSNSFPDESKNLAEPYIKGGVYASDDGFEPIEISIWEENNNPAGCLITYDFFMDNSGFHNFNYVSENKYCLSDNPDIILEFNYHEDDTPISVYLGTESNTSVGSIKGYHTVTIYNEGNNLGTYRQDCVTLNE